MWLEFKTVFDTLSHDSEVRAIILSGAGDRAFTTGLDVQAASQSGILQQQAGKTEDVARKAVGIKRHVEEFQNCIGSVEKCEKRELAPPQIACLEMIVGSLIHSSCDMRNAWLYPWFGNGHIHLC